MFAGVNKYEHLTIWCIGLGYSGVNEHLVGFVQQQISLSRASTYLSDLWVNIF